MQSTQSHPPATEIHPWSAGVPHPYPQSEMFWYFALLALIMYLTNGLAVLRTDVVGTREQCLPKALTGYLIYILQISFIFQPGFSVLEPTGYRTCWEQQRFCKWQSVQRFQLLSTSRFFATTGVVPWVRSWLWREERVTRLDRSFQTHLDSKMPP